MNKNKKDDVLIDIEMDNFIFFHDLNASLYVTTTQIEGNKTDNIIVRLEEGRFKGTILRISNISIPEETKNIMKFDLDLLQDPNENKRINKKYIETIAKNIMLKMIERGVREMEKNDNRIINSQESNS